jgi:hypothetical protein
MHWLKPILLLALIAFPAQMTQMALSPVDELLQEYARRVRQDAGLESKFRSPMRCSANEGDLQGISCILQQTAY